MRNYCHILFILFVLLARAVDAAVTPVYLYDMDQDPTELGWSVVTGGGGSHAVSGGILTINSGTYYEFTAPSNLWNLSVSNARGWQVQTRMRIVQSTHPNLRIWIDDNTVLNYLDIQQNSLTLFGGTNNPNYVYPYDIGTDFHTYFFRGIGQKIDIFVDGNHVVDLVRPTTAQGTPHKMFFGDGWFDGVSVSEWDYYQFSTIVPEPALLVTASFFLVSTIRSRTQYSQKGRAIYCG